VTLFARGVRRVSVLSGHLAGAPPPTCQLDHSDLIEKVGVGTCSTKPITGHMMGAAGAAETVVCALALKNQIIPPTINLNEPDDAWGSSTQQTYFRNMLRGWQKGSTNGSTPIIHRSYTRAFNIVGNVLGQPGFHSQYQTIATSNTSVTGGDEYKSIYALGTAFDTSCGTGAVRSSPYCDPKAVSTLMRWANYDVVTSGTRYDASEASPAAVPYVNSNFSSSYFSSLSHGLPASLYRSSTPSWWPSGKSWPAIGPDVSNGNVGICTGTYSGSEGTTDSQCSGGSLTAEWGSHVTSIPAQDCYLNVMHGQPDGAGNALSFDASQCYGSSGTSTGTTVGSPTGLTAVVY